MAIPSSTLVYLVEPSSIRFGRWLAEASSSLLERLLLATPNSQLATRNLLLLLVSANGFALQIHPPLSIYRHCLLDCLIGLNSWRSGSRQLNKLLTMAYRKCPAKEQTSARRLVRLPGFIPYRPIHLAGGFSWAAVCRRWSQPKVLAAPLSLSLSVVGATCRGRQCVR